MEEIKINNYKVEVENSSLTITKGYGYMNKENKQRYSALDVYYIGEDGKTFRKHSNEKGEFYYNVDLVDVVVETFPMKDGQIGSKTYPLSEVPYLAENSDNVNLEQLENFLKFKLHR